MFEKIMPPERVIWLDNMDLIFLKQERFGALDRTMQGPIFLLIAPKTSINH